LKVCVLRTSIRFGFRIADHGGRRPGHGLDHGERIGGIDLAAGDGARVDATADGHPGAADAAGAHVDLDPGAHVVVQLHRAPLVEASRVEPRSQLEGRTAQLSYILILRENIEDEAGHEAHAVGRLVHGSPPDGRLRRDAAEVSPPSRDELAEGAALKNAQVSPRPGGSACTPPS
jgi:hypothetical protein